MDLKWQNPRDNAPLSVHGLSILAVTVHIKRVQL